MQLTSGAAVHVVLGIYHRVPWTIATVALGAAVETIGVSMINRSVNRRGARLTATVGWPLLVGPLDVLGSQPRWPVGQQ